MMKRIAMISALLVALSPVGMMAAAKGQGKRPEVAQLKAKREALRAEIQAAKANGNISPEDRAKFRADRAQVKKEAAALNLQKSQRLRKRSKVG